MKKSSLIIVAVIIYIATTLVSFAVFANTGLGPKKFITSSVPTPKQKADGTLVFDQTLPKIESCPLNGEKYSKQQREWWEKHRPLGIMIENHQESRPQSGISSADVVYEAIAEGGITRFLVVFHCQDGSQVGPVRSARTYFIDFLSEYGVSPLYAHVGGANTPGPADALGQLTDYGWTGYNDLNQFSIGFPTFWRDYDRLGREVATEHTMYSTTTKLWNFAAKSRKLTNVDEDGVQWDDTFVSYTFKEDAAQSDRPTQQIIDIAFWDRYKDYAVRWIYDKATNSYKRTNGGQPHTDKNNNQQLTAKNVVVLYMTERNADDGYENNAHLLYGTKGTGKATVFQDGKEIKGRWKKDSRTARTLLYDTSGKPIQLNPGRIWFSILPTDGEVTVK